MSRISDELRTRTKSYASRIIHLYANSPRGRREVEVLGHQLLRSGTSVAANIREASRSRSDNEFFSKISIALQEADESLLWLELLGEDCNLATVENLELQRETNELISIFVVMIARGRKSSKT